MKQVVLIAVILLTTSATWGAPWDQEAPKPIVYDFEASLDDWEYISGDVSLSSDAAEGQHAVLVDGRDALEGRVSSPYNSVVPNGIYELEAKIKRVEGTGIYGLTLAWLDGANNVISYANDWQGYNGSSEYKQFRYRFQAPPNAVTCNISPAAQSGNVYLFDDIRLTYIDTISPPPLAIKIAWLNANGRVLDLAEPFGSYLYEADDPTDLWAKGLENSPIFADDFSSGDSWTPDAIMTCEVGKGTIRQGEAFSASFNVEPLRVYAVTVSAGNHQYRAYFGAGVDAATAQVSLRGDNVSFREMNVRAIAPISELDSKKLWMMPHGTVDQNPLFVKDAAWPETRNLIGVYKAYGTTLAPNHEYHADWELDVPQMTRALQAAGLKLGLDVAGLYGGEAKGDPDWALETELGWVDRVYEFGGSVDYLCLDGPISRVIKGGRVPGNGGAAGTPGLSLEQSVANLTQYLKGVHAKHPDISIGLIVNSDWWDFGEYKSYFGLTSHSYLSGHVYDDVLVAVLRALEGEEASIDFIQVDCPFEYYVMRKSPYMTTPMNDTGKMLAIERFCREHGLQFGLMYNAEDAHTEREYYEKTLWYLQLHHAAGSRPDQYVLQSWYDVNETVVPEDQPYSFTYMAREVARRMQGK